MSHQSVEFVSPPAGVEAPQVETKPAATERPTWLPENIESGEALAKSYKELQAELTRMKQGLPPKADEKPADPAAAATEQKPADQQAEPPKDLKVPEQKPEDKVQEAAENALKAAGIDLATYSEKFVADGDIAVEDRTKIAEGLKSVFGDEAIAYVNDYIEGAKMRRDAAVASYMDAAGGADRYPKMMEWAASSLSADEIAAYNATVGGTDPNAVRFAIAGLRARFEAAVGKEPALIQPGTTKGPASAGFATNGEMLAAMRDPRYHKDREYTLDVERRVRLMSA